MRWIRLVVGLLLLAMTLVVYAFWWEPTQLVVRHESVEVAGLTAPVTLLLVGDIQPAGPHQSVSGLTEIADRLAQEDVDAIVWVGDFVSERGTSTAFIHPEHTARALGKLHAPSGHFAVLGNHDWYWNGPEMERLLEQHGVDVLRDERRILSTPGGPLAIVGLEDPVTQQPDLEGALQGTESMPTVLLSHTPDVFPDVPEHVDLTLAGHTHCGQVTLPFLGRPVVPSAFGDRFAAGWFGAPGHRMFVTCGIGTAILPVRFGNPPEAVVLELLPDSAPVTIESR